MVAHPQEIDIAFAGNHELRKRVHDALDHHPTQSTLFRDISTYILNQASQPSAEPSSKKRKLEGSNGVQNGAAASSVLTTPAGSTWKSYPGVSFSIPQRKKYTLELLEGSNGGARAIGADGSVEFGLAWRDIDQVFCLPVPEKAKRQHNFLLLPIHGDGVNPTPEHLKASPPEPMMWTFEEATGKNIVEGEDSGPSPMAEAIRHCLHESGTPKTVIFPDAQQFVSAIPQSHRKAENAYHVKAHRGSKEGYLFFTSVGIVWGFKKPLAFLDFASVDSVSYTNVLRNTFNLVVTTPTGEIEFGMIDQADYTGINEYVQKHGLQDASMAAERRAQKLNINPTPEQAATASGGSAAADDGLTELQRAEQQMQDLEDEEEEDYDPGSEGESEGSGSDSDDEDEDEDEDGEGYEEGDEEGEGEEMEGQE